MMILTDRDVINRVMLDLADTHTLWRNNVGALKNEHGRLVRYGLHPGSSDLIGFETYNMSGLPWARFTAIECKSATDRLSAAQRQFLAHVRDSGGIAQVAQADRSGVVTIREYEG